MCSEICACGYHNYKCNVWAQWKRDGRHKTHAIYSLYSGDMSVRSMSSYSHIQNFMCMSMSMLSYIPETDEAVLVAL